jgi:hypothetical protein
MLPLKIVHEPPTEMLYGDEALEVAARHTLDEIECSQVELKDAERLEGDKVVRLKRLFWQSALAVAVVAMCTLPFIVERWIVTGLLAAACVLVPLHVYIERRIHQHRHRQWYAAQVYRLAALIRAELDAVSLAASEIRVHPTKDPPGSTGPD